MSDENGRMTFAERVVTVKRRSRTVRVIVESLPGWVTPNLVTVFRGALSIPVFFALTSGRYWLAASIFACAMALDAVDGAIAHVRGMHTPLGAFIDPLADKLLVYGALLALWARLPPWIDLLVAGSLLFAAGLTLVRVARVVRTRKLDGGAIVSAIAAKPAGKMKTLFDVLAAACIMGGMAQDSAAAVDAGGAVMVLGATVAGYVHFSRPRPR